MNIEYKQIIIEFFRDSVTWLITEFPKIIVITIIFLLLFRFIKKIIKGFTRLILKQKKNLTPIEESEKNKRVNTLSEIIATILKVLLVFLYIVIILDKFGIAIGPILASAGILGLAVGFGAQELVRDMISGFFILLEDQIRIGDYVQLNGTFGEVESIELRTIQLRDPSGTVHVFQNGKIDTLSNMSKEWSAIILDIGVAYKEDLDHVSQVMQKVGDEMYNDTKYRSIMLQRLEILGLNEFGDSALIVRARLKTVPGVQWSTAREYRKRLKKAFDKENIEIPFPHRTIYWGEEIAPLKLKNLKDKDTEE